MKPGHDKKPVRIQVDVDGYTWRIHGARSGRLWQAHLVELVGPLPLDGPVTQPLRDKIRMELAKALQLEDDAVARISEDLILA
jgi:hypothetical protein